MEYAKKKCRPANFYNHMNCDYCLKKVRSLALKAVIIPVVGDGSLHKAVAINSNVVILTARETAPII